MRLVLVVVLVTSALVVALKPAPEHEESPLRRQEVDLIVPGPGVGGGSAERFLPF